MRVISGSAKGRKLFTPKSLRIRPTADRVKESLFNILSVQFGSFSRVRVLDIFAGTGNLGIEALSRGAIEVVFVDQDREAASLVKRNLDVTGFSDRSRLVQQEALGALKALELSDPPFELVFLDPPYQEGLSERILAFLGGSRLLDEGSLVVAETAAKEELPCSFGSLVQFDRRLYGDTAIAFFMLEKNEAP